MSPAVLIGVIVLVGTVAIIAFTVRYMRTPRSALPAELLARRRALLGSLDAIVANVPERPSLSSREVPDHPQAASIEAKLLGGNTDAALDEAEALLAESPDDPRVALLLARALIHSHDVDAAIQQLERARSLGASGPMLDYLEGRAQYGLVVRRTTTDEAAPRQLPPLITPFEMFVLQLDRQRQRSDEAAAVWIATLGNVSIDHEHIATLVSEYFGAYYECLDKLIAAALREPGFSDALYHIARLALKVGFMEQGIELLTKIEPLMAASPERRSYERDLAQLRDEPAPSEPPPTPPGARRSVRLKVLN